MYIIKSNSQVLWFVFLASVLTFGVIVNKALPYVGFGFAWGLLSTAIYLQKPYKDRFVHVAYVLSMALSFCFFWRAHPLLTFFNGMAMIGLTSVMALIHDDTKFPGILQMLTSPLVLFVRSINTKVDYTADMSGDRLAQFLRKLKFQESFVSVAVTAAVLIIIIPLLASSNPFFKHALDSVAALLNLQQLLEKLQAFEFTSWTVLQLVVWGFLLVAVPRLLGYMAGQIHSDAKPVLTERSMSLPKIVVAGVLLLYFATQVQLYFASDAQLLAIGSTPSQRTNEVFGQLSVVIGVILSLLYFFRSYTTKERRITWVLLVESLFLIAIAWSSVFQYAYNFGFTFKRLWGLGVVLWLVVVIALYAYTYWKKIAHEYFVQALLLVSALALLLVNVANFDYLIAHVHQPRTGEGVDYLYMRHNLSADARAHRLLLEAFENQAVESTNESAKSFAFFNKNAVNTQISRLKLKYADPDWRTVNIGQLWAYRAVEDYDPEADMQLNQAREAEWIEQQEKTAVPN